MDIVYKDMHGRKKIVHGHPYTGIADMNGAPIYEGDRVECEYRRGMKATGTVMFSPDDFKQMPWLVKLDVPLKDDAGTIVAIALHGNLSRVLSKERRQ